MSNFIVVLTAYVTLMDKFCDGEIINSDGSDYTCIGTEDCTINCPLSGCQSTIFNCPPDLYNCQVNCAATGACYDAVINWPKTVGLGNLTCDGRDSCRNVYFPIPDPNKALTITCNSDSECDESTINCPINANCTVNCMAYDACNLATINWPTGTQNRSTLICEGTNACRETNFPIPDPYIPLTITCDSKAECRESVIYCPTDANCTVECIAGDACFRTRIVWPTNHTVTNILICSTDSYSCDYATIPPIYVTAENNNDYYLNCTTPNQCENYTVTCPQNFGCFIKCNNIAACKNMVINWVESQPHYIQCDKWYAESCRGVNSISYYDPYMVPSSEYIIDCGASYMCSYATINCPKNSNCKVLCDNEIEGYSCWHSTIIGPINNSLNITCLGNHGCDGSIWYGQHTSSMIIDGCNTGNSVCAYITAYFPPMDYNGNKIAIFNGPDNSLINHLKFYAINGWLDIDIRNYNGLNYAGGDSRLFCGIDYTLSCVMSNTEWHGGCGVCDNPQITYNPTISPVYINTINPTTSPITSNPTASPTTYGPTSSPTTYGPTSSPTTYNPTTSPTTNNPTTATISPTTYGPTSSPTTYNPTASPTSTTPIKFGTDTGNRYNINIISLLFAFVCYLL